MSSATPSLTVILVSSFSHTTFLKGWAFYKGITNAGMLLSVKEMLSLSTIQAPLKPKKCSEVNKFWAQGAPFPSG